MSAYDPRDPATIANPFPAFAALRESAPVYWSELLGGWVLTRYDDVKLAISDRRFSADRIRPFFEQLPSDRQAAYRELGDSIRRWAVFHDPPEHTRLRGVMNKAFTATAVERLAKRVQQIVDGLLDRVTSTGRMDVIADLAYPLPATVILEMLGLPLSALESIKHWSDELALFVGSSVNAPDKYSRAHESICAMNEFFHAAIIEHGRGGADNLLSSLIHARDHGKGLSDDELVATCVLLVFAGHETTTNLIGNSLVALLQHPTELARLRREPELITPAVEEFLRFDGPAASVVRIAHEDVMLHGQEIGRGDRVFAMLNAANRDPRAFPDPDRLDVGRRENRHLAFGHGIHFCVGAPLARLEARIAIATLIDRCHDMTLDTDYLEWSDSMVLRGVRNLPIQFQPAK